MSYLDANTVANFIRNERTKQLVQCLENKSLWRSFFDSLKTNTTCSACATASPKAPCITEGYTVGCHRCFSMHERCSIVEEYREKTLVLNFNESLAGAKEYIHKFSALEAHLKRMGANKQLTTWDEVEAIERGGKMGEEQLSSALNDLRILHMRMELVISELIQLRRLNESFCDTIYEISLCATEARASTNPEILGEAVWEIEGMAKDALGVNADMSVWNDLAGNA
ncbi:hypothetical protein BKA70DRAFT_1239656 [Coprinopsis sp. MPI-PUGE-AT-0042]|nr:hypothetical protein BKA70DRAFT_1239656 [Coprinopsis sp. MPI-PUGE-AT-0042]